MQSLQHILIITRNIFNPGMLYKRASLEQYAPRILVEEFLIREWLWKGHQSPESIFPRSWVKDCTT